MENKENLFKKIHQIDKNKIKKEIFRNEKS